MASISAGVEDPTESAPAASGTGNVDAEGFEETISIDELGGGKRKLVRLSSGRGVLLLSHGGEVFATDHACYHHGGPLATGDIEDLGDHPCIICPWHKYKLSLKTGEGLYIGIDPFTKDAAGKPVKMVKSKGVKQRVHPVRVQGGMVWVKDSGAGDGEQGTADATAPDAAPAGTTRGSSEEQKYAVASDQYACEGFARTAKDGIHSSSKDFR